MEIIYKKGIRNGYAKIENGGIKLIIPYIARNDQKFLEKIQLLGIQLQQKLHRKERYQIFNSEGVLLFGERIPLVDFPQFQNEKERASFFKQELFDYAYPILQTYARKLGFHDIPLSIRKVKSKRGSCTYDNRIMLNLSLVHLSTKLIQYVIIHEVCHLKEKNHSGAFWSLVGEHCPQFKQYRKELKNLIFVG